MENLEYYGLIDARENISIQTRWATVDLLEYYKENSKSLGNQEWVTLNTREFYRIEFRDMIPGTVFKLDGEKIAIGATGAYIADAANDMPFKEVQIAPRDMAQGQATYSYKAKAANVFGTIDKIEIEDVPCWQWVGQYPTTPGDRYNRTLEAVIAYNREHPNEIKTDSASLYEYRSWGLKNLLEEIENCKVEILHIAHGRFLKRPMIDVFISNTDSRQSTYLMATGGKNGGYLIGMNQDSVYINGQFDHQTLRFYSNSECTPDSLIEWEDLDPYCLYNVRFGRTDFQDLVREGYILDRIERFVAPDTGFYYDPKSDTMSRVEDDLFEVYVGDDHFSVLENERVEVKNISDYSRNIRISAGVIAELSFSKQIAVYTFETEEPCKSDLVDYKNALSGYKTAVLKFDQELPAYNSNLNQKRQLVKDSYNYFIETLTNEIADYKEANGIV